MPANVRGSIMEYESLCKYEAFWENRGDIKKRGKPLPLLSYAEILKFKSLLSRVLDHKFFYDENGEAYTNRLSDMYSVQHSIDGLRKVRLRLNNAWWIAKNPNVTTARTFTVQDLEFVNSDINQYFSIEGWRLVRAEMQQISKRQNIKRIPVDLNIFHRLNKLIKLESFDSYSSCIDSLLCEYYDANELNNQ